MVAPPDGTVIVPFYLHPIAFRDIFEIDKCILFKQRCKP